jgi:hypothetical protein
MKNRVQSFDLLRVVDKRLSPSRKLTASPSLLGLDERLALISPVDTGKPRNHRLLRLVRDDAAIVSGSRSHAAVKRTDWAFV